MTCCATKYASKAAVQARLTGVIWMLITFRVACCAESRTLINGLALRAMPGRSAPMRRHDGQRSASTLAALGRHDAAAGRRGSTRTRIAAGGAKLYTDWCSREPS